MPFYQFLTGSSGACRKLMKGVQFWKDCYINRVDSLLFLRRKGREKEEKGTSHGIPRNANTHIKNF